MTDDEVRELLLSGLDKQCDRIAYDMLIGTTAKPSEEPLTLGKITAAIARAKKLARNDKRNGVTFVVDLAHEGPMLQTRHPTDGEFIELTWLQAQYVHDYIMPLVLRKVRSHEAAEFVPAPPFQATFPRWLPAPPYDLAD